MTLVNRKAAYKLYPNRAQSEALREMLVLHQRLYNARLEQRKWAYEWKRRIERYRDLTPDEERQYRQTNSFYGQRLQ